ncbi:MAG TPA: VIT1/CCC1 transporter family protein [Propionicimonas sp.]|jgi:VIT1/CCC1 family predicted Fe2+/Mn2+ transporter
MVRPWLQNDERHRSDRGGWLRAAVLGADDGVVSTASLMLGVAAASASTQSVLVAGVAGLVAGAMSMAAGEYVSVSSQRDAERADIALEKSELASNPKGERRELEAIYRERGLDAELARKVAEQLSGDRGLVTHLRDELGLQDSSLARPLQAASVSAASFASLALLPLAALLLAPAAWRVPAIVGSALASLAVLGGLGGRLGGAPVFRAAVRAMAGGGFAMAVTAGMGRLLALVALG